MDKKYNHTAVEEKWLDFWLRNRLNHAVPVDGRPSYSMVIPPPNVTAVLHLGHALNNTIQDILIRYKRMQGFVAEWMPGTDHAGIATQNVVERKIASEQGKTRQDLGREAFIEEMWKFREETGGTIIEQLKRLGCSCDWERERFTMDDGLSVAVTEVFVRL
jgi:valyl-tRNA synthetase